MHWRQTATIVMGEMLRFLGRVFLFLDVILVCAFSTWFLGKFLWFAMNWINGHLFGAAW